MLYVPQPQRATPISSVNITSESITTTVIGSTPEAEWVSQRIFEELWVSAGAQRSWADVSSHLQLVRYATTTTFNPGPLFIDFFSRNFRDYINIEIEGPAAFGSKMGAHPPVGATSEDFREDLIVMCKPMKLVLNVILFDKVCGRQEECELKFAAKSRLELGRPSITVSSELDSDRHSQLVHALYTGLKDQTK
jgi:hypothetical protein